MLTSFGFIYFSFNQDVNLVEDNYYEKEIKYQDQIERIDRANALPEKVKVKVTEHMIEFTFPSMFSPENLSGEIHLYRPSTEKADLLYDIKLNNQNKVYIPTDELASGMWKTKIHWKVDSLDYFTEKIVMLR